MRAIPFLLLALLTGTAASAAPRLTDAQRLRQRTAGLVPGAPTTCVTLGPTVQSETFEGAILYRRGGTTYINRFGGNCPLRPNFDTLITRTPTNQLCRGDIAQIVDQAARFPKGSCAFDDWETYTRSKPAK